jgi:hypothetical protein
MACTMASAKAFMPRSPGCAATPSCEGPLRARRVGGSPAERAGIHENAASLLTRLTKHLVLGHISPETTPHHDQRVAFRQGASQPGDCDPCCLLRRKALRHPASMNRRQLLGTAGVLTAGAPVWTLKQCGTAALFWLALRAGWLLLLVPASGGAGGSVGTAQLPPKEKTR